MVGLWPAVTRRLHRPKLTAPAAVRPDETFDVAFLMEDMTTALVAASAKPIRLRRSDLAIFAKAEEEIAANLMPLPEWVGATAKTTVSSRIDAAARWLRALKLLRMRSSGGDPCMEPTRRAADWLAQTAKNRLKTIFDHLRPGTSPTGKRASATVRDEDDEQCLYDYYEQSSQTALLPFPLDVLGSPAVAQEMAVALAGAFGAVPECHYCPEDVFLAWRSQEHNPLPKVFSKAHHRYFSLGVTIESLEAQWAQDLAEFLHLRLLPLGGARLGTSKGRICFTLTPAGRYLLGLADDFDYGHGHDPQGHVIVQPNFEVMFLAPSPLAEAALARVAERRSRGTGAVFQITRKSVLAAASSGMTAEQTLDMLQHVSSKPLPGNVVREIQGWFDQCRRITVEPTVLIRCPDADTATRVVAASGGQAVAITETVVELQDAQARKELLRKLHGQGVFVDRPAEHPAGPHDVHRPRRRRW